MTTIPCLLCAAKIKRRKDKHGKPYFVCDPCGVQLFIRRKQGIDNLAELIAKLKLHDFRFHEHTYVLCEIQAVLAEMRGIKKEIKAIEDEFFLIEEDNEDKARVLKPLNARIENLLTHIDQIARRRV